MNREREREREIRWIEREGRRERGSRMVSIMVV